PRARLRAHRRAEVRRLEIRPVARRGADAAHARPGRQQRSRRRMTRSKTLATWLALLGGSVGAHRLYLRGPRDVWAWLHAVPTLLGAYGAMRMRALGQDDRLGSVLVLLLGLMLAGTMLLAIVYGLTSDEK